MGESTRPLPPLIPLSNGGWEVNSFLSSAEYTIRGMGLVPPNHIVPVIVVPGIMGTNLRARRTPRLGRVADERNQAVKPGEAVWRPPNGTREGLYASYAWGAMDPSFRQKLLDLATLEVDDAGPIVLPLSDDGYVLSEQDVRERGWGEVHADSYGPLLYALQKRLNQTFEFDEARKKPSVRQHWKDVMACDPKRWGVREFAPLTETDLKAHAKHYFPVYSVGYCWLDDCEVSSRLLERRVLDIIGAWRKVNRRCEKVILVTHSMGGLVARACAKRIPNQIAGVIHGVMPALGAPVAYRRLACGTETRSPSNNPGENIEASKLAQILGETPQKTMPVLAISPGALEMLPNHLYPQPWLHVRVMKSVGIARSAGYGVRDDLVRQTETPVDYLHLPNARAPNPYDLYRDFKSWFRVIDPALADPSDKFRAVPGGIEKAIRSAIERAETFHRELGSYYHPNTYAFYGDAQNKLSYGQVRWVAPQGTGAAGALTPGNIAGSRFLGYTKGGHRRILVEEKVELHFSADIQDARGDGTVPYQSGGGPAGMVKQLFATQGYEHQESYKDEDILMLTLRLIVKIVQEIS